MATDIYTHTRALSTFIHSHSHSPLTHFIFSWVCNVLCGMWDNLNTHSVILFSSSYICVDILSALDVFTAFILITQNHRILSHFAPFLRSFVRWSSLDAFFSQHNNIFLVQDHNLLIFAHHLSSHHTYTAWFSFVKINSGEPYKKNMCSHSKWKWPWLNWYARAYMYYLYYIENHIHSYTQTHTQSQCNYFVLVDLSYLSACLLAFVCMFVCMCQCLFRSFFNLGPTLCEVCL